MKRLQCERGATLVELIVVVGIIVSVAGALGTLFLAGPTAAVAAAVTGVSAAFDEARRTANAFDAATVVFAPAASGTGFSVRIYRRFPGDAHFAPANGPVYESGVAAEETAAPLGRPGIAFTLDHRGNVSGFAGFHANANSFAARACPAGGTFLVTLRAGPQARTLAIPCAPSLTATSPGVSDTAPPAATPAPVPTALSGACLSGNPCPLPTLAIVAPPSAPPAHQQVADRCGVPAGQLADTDATTTPPTDHLTDGVPCATPAPPAPPPFPGSVSVTFWVEECPGGPVTCDGGTQLEDDSPASIVGGPADYVACLNDPHPLGSMPRSIDNPGPNALDVHGSSNVRPSNPTVHYQTRWDIVVPAGLRLTFAPFGTAGC